MNKVMVGRILVLKDPLTSDYVHWLDKMGLAETMKIMVDSYPAINMRYDKTTLYLPKRWSAWWKL